MAKSINNGIGDKNKLLWNIPEDLKYFKEKTEGHSCIMGMKTFESIIWYLKQPLKNRINIVLSKEKHYDPLCSLKGIKTDKEIQEYRNNIIVFDFYEDLLIYIKNRKDRQFFVIGGAQIYNLMIPHVETIFLTEILQTFEGDTICDLKEQENFIKIDESPLKQYKDLSYLFKTYKKKTD